MDSTRSLRAERGGCTWDETDAYRAARADLDADGHPLTPHVARDVLALAMFDAIIARVQHNGIDADEYKAPLRGASARMTRPWLGEFRQTGVARKAEGGAREYRLYFAEAPTGGLGLLGALIGFKTYHEMHARASRLAVTTRAHMKQTKQIDDAQSATIRHCRKNGWDFREL